MNTNDVLTKLKAEIERLKGQLIRGACAAQIEMETNCKDEAYNEVLAFLDTLSKEPMCLYDGGVPNKQKWGADHLRDSTKMVDKDLEEAAEEYATTHLRNNEFPTADSAFIAVAEWQKDKDTRDMLMSDNRHFDKIYELGKKDMKDQMMKEAVEFVCIGKKVKMTVQELINYYIDAECCEVADECGF